MGFDKRFKLYQYIAFLPARREKERLQFCKDL